VTHILWQGFARWVDVLWRQEAVGWRGLASSINWRGANAGVSPFSRLLIFWRAVDGAVKQSGHHSRDMHRSQIVSGESGAVRGEGLK